MKDKELKKLGFHKEGNIENRYFHEEFGVITIPSNSSLKKILKLVFEKAYSTGFNNGKIYKSNEIKKILDIEINHNIN